MTVYYQQAKTVKESSTYVYYHFDHFWEEPVQPKRDLECGLLFETKPLIEVSTESAIDGIYLICRLHACSGQSVLCSLQ
jgi:hypothetical protein